MTESNSIANLSGIANSQYNQKNYPDAIKTYQKLLKIKKSWKLYLSLGWALFKQEDFEKSANAFKQSLLLKDYWYSWQSLGSALMRNEKYYDANICFRRSLTLKENWKTYKYLGISLSNTVFYSEAIGAFKSSLKLSEDWKTYQSLAFLYLRNDDIDNAIEMFIASINLKEDWYSYRGLGLAYLNISKNSKAADTFLKGISLKQDYKSYQCLGLACFRLNKIDESIDAFSESISLKEDWNSYRGLGLAQLKASKYAEAIVAFQKSLNLKTNWSSYRGLGLALIYSNKTKEGLIQLLETCKNNVSWIEIHNISEELVKNNYISVAIQFFIELQKVYPDHLFIACEQIMIIKKANKTMKYAQLFATLKANISNDLLTYYERWTRTRYIIFNDSLSMCYAKDNFSSSKFIPTQISDRSNFWIFALNKIKLKDGLILEFGVFKGKSISFIAEYLPDENIHGFDSFEGFPENYNNDRKKGTTSTNGYLPNVPNNVYLYKGWFKNTLAKFLSSNPLKKSSFIHIDCVLYSSTKEVLLALRCTIVPGTIIVLDEYYNYSDWRNYEYKAFHEFVNLYNISYKYLAYTDQQVCIEIIDIRN